MTYWSALWKPIVTLLSVVIGFFLLIQIDPPDTAVVKIILELTLVLGLTGAVVLTIDFLFSFQFEQRQTGRVTQKNRWNLWTTTAPGEDNDRPVNGGESRTTTLVDAKFRRFIEVHPDRNDIERYLKGDNHS